MRYIYTTPAATKLTVWEATESGKPSKKGGSGWPILNAVKKLFPAAGRADGFSVFEHCVTFTFGDRLEIEDFKTQLYAAGVLRAARRSRKDRQFQVAKIFEF